MLLDTVLRASKPITTPTGACAVSPRQKVSDEFLRAFTFDAHHAKCLLDKSGTHLLISVEALLLSVVIAVPIGILLGHIHRFSFVAINVSNFGRALPSLAILSILLVAIGIGRLEVVIALFVLAFPPILTNTFVAVDQVDQDAVEAAKGMGYKPWQVIWHVELPMSLSLIFAGIRTSAVFVVATATLAGTFGGGGLGDIITNEPNFKIVGVIGAVYVLIVLAFAAQGLFLMVERLVTPRGLRAGRTGTMGRVVDEKADDLLPAAA